MSVKRADIVLGTGNYFYEEFAIQITLARKRLLAHNQIVKSEVDMIETWVLNDTKAMEIIAQGVAIEHHTKIRSATTANTRYETSTAA